MAKTIHQTSFFMVEKHVYTYLTYKHGGFWGWFSSLVLTTEKRTGRETKHAETQPDAQRSRNASQARLPQKTPEFCDRTHGYIYICYRVYNNNNNNDNDN